MQKPRVTKTDASVYNKLNFNISNFEPYLDTPLVKYQFSPTLSSSEGKRCIKYTLNWQATRTNLLSQGVYNAANAQLSMRNLWRIEDGLYGQRGDELHLLGQYAANHASSGPLPKTAMNDDAALLKTGWHSNAVQPAADYADGVWTQLWGGKYSFGGMLGSTMEQSYTGFQLGYDKLREGRLFGGRLYTGMYISRMKSAADVRAHTLNEAQVDYTGSRNELQSDSIGLYTSWLGEHGHYLDLMVRGSRLDDTYKFTNSDGTAYDNIFNTWAYGINVRYGIQQRLPHGWFIEPQAGLSYGKVRGYEFRQANGMHYTVDGMSSLVGRLGIRAGKSFGPDGSKGQAYLKAAVNHDFRDSGTARAAVEQYNYVTRKWATLQTMPVDTLAGHDTWYELGLGLNLQTAENSNAFLEVAKTFGGEVKTDWQLRGGMSWSFNGPSGKEETAAKALDNAAAAKKQTLQPALYQGGRSHGLRYTSEGNLASDEAEMADSSVAGSSTLRNAAANGSAAWDDYTLEDSTVEAVRPQWEKQLSPGTVSVIHVQDYKGEMKNLPELLQTIPGVYVQMQSGTGHYSVAHVRGSSGGQVNIYIDGVLYNSASDSAVDLSTIPVDNVDHIEVYRGYVPARFAGSPLGGAINIVTKKPEETRGSYTVGMRSFGGTTSNLELTAPAGSGSLMFALNRDQARGNFNFNGFFVYGNGANYYNEPSTQTNNAFQKTDVLLKWQDKNWFVKLAWKKDMTELPSLHYHSTKNPMILNRQLVTTKDELQFGRRQTVGDLEWGWKLAASYQTKEANNATYKSVVGGYGLFNWLNLKFHNRAYEASVDGSWRMGKAHLMEFLLDYSRESMDVSPSDASYWAPDGMGVLNNPKIAGLYVNHYTNRNMYFQLQDTMTLDKRGSFFFTPQLKGQKWSMDAMNNLEDPNVDRWKYTMSFALKKVQGPHWTFRGTWGTYYKYPNFYELFGDGVNVKSRWQESGASYSDTIVEHGTSWDIGANWQGTTLGADSDITLTYFDRHVDNMSCYATDFNGFGFYSNLGAGKIHGLELESNMKWNRWNLQLAVTKNDSMITDPSVARAVTAGQSKYVCAGEPFPGIPEWEYNLRLGYRFPGDKLDAFVEYHYLGEVGQISNNYGAKVSCMNEALGLTNIGFKYKFDDRFKLTTGINDVFNRGPNQRHYVMTSGKLYSLSNVDYPQQGRTYYATLQYFF